LQLLSKEATGRMPSYPGETGNNGVQKTQEKPGLYTTARQDNVTLSKGRKTLTGKRPLRINAAAKNTTTKREILQDIGRKTTR